MMNNPFDITKGLKGLEAFLWEEEHNKQLMFETMANLVGSYENDYSEEESDILVSDALDELDLTRDDFSDEAWTEINEKAQYYCD